MDGTVSFEPETDTERLTAVVAAALIAPATVGYLSLLEGWYPQTAASVAVLISVWLVVAFQRLSRGEFAVGLTTGTVSGTVLGLTYYTHLV